MLGRMSTGNFSKFNSGIEGNLQLLKKRLGLLINEELLRNILIIL